MSTASMVLLAAGIAASLAGVWALAGLSERSSLRGTPRVVLAGVLGALGLGVAHQRAPADLRLELSLALLFGAVNVLGVVVGGAKLEGALAAKNGRRALRRASGLVLGVFLGMASIAAVSFELVLRSFTHARHAWAFMLPTAVAALIVFTQRGKLAGAGAKALGRKGLLLAGAGVAALIVGRALVSPAAVQPEPIQPAKSEPISAQAPTPDPVAPPAHAVASGATGSGSAARAAGEIASASPIASTAPGPAQLLLEAVTTRGMLEADARGGVTRRMDRLQACLEDPANQQSGALQLKVGIDAAGSVTYSKATGGDLLGTPLATCLLPVFYKMGFAAPASGEAYFEITLRAPPR